MAFLLQENGDKILQENGDKILLDELPLVVTLPSISSTQLFGPALAGGTLFVTTASISTTTLGPPQFNSQEVSWGFRPSTLVLYPPFVTGQQQGNAVMAFLLGP